MKLGKTLIIGDSYSTYEGQMPEGYDWFFPNKYESENDVRKLEYTWWYNIFDGKDNVLLRNDSFSGTTVCNTVRPEHRVEWSFINRFDGLVKDGFFEKEKPDTVLVFGGTNDLWIESPVGKCQFDNFTKEDLDCFLPACGYLASRLKEEFPDAVVCWLINTEFSEEFVNGITETAKYFGQKYLAFKEIDKISGHPSIVGMKQIRDELEESFN